MPTLTPIDHDPFAPPAGQSLTPVDHDPFAQSPTSGVPLKITVTPPGSQSAPAQSGIGQQLATSFMNVGPAASQGTNPDVGLYKNLVSGDVHESDSGELLYRDPTSGKMVPTDTNTQVAIRDPVDNTVKIFARTPETNESAPVSFSRVVTQGLGAGAPTARPGIPSMPASAGPKASDIFATAKPYYRAFGKDASQIDVPAQTATNYADRLEGALRSSNFIRSNAKPVFNAIDETLRGGQVETISDLQKVKSIISELSTSIDPPVRRAAGIAKREIARIISETAPEAGQSLKTADEIQSSAYALRELQQKEAIAGLRQGRAGYGGNVNALGQVLSPIVEASIKGRVTSFKPAELQAMKDLVEHSSGMSSAARLVGMASPTKGSIPTFAAIGTAVATGNPLPLAIPALGAASNRLAKVLDARQMNRIKEMVARRSPAYAQAVANAVERYDKAQTAFVTNPSPNRLSSYVNASRALSYGLTKDGISVSSGSLIKMIQGPAKGRAEDE